MDGTIEMGARYGHGESAQFHFAIAVRLTRRLPRNYHMQVRYALLEMEHIIVSHFEQQLHNVLVLARDGGSHVQRLLHQTLTQTTHQVSSSPRT